MSDGGNSDDENSLAKRLERLKKSTVGASETRERLPQPLFWSLFHAELKELKREKALARALDEVFGK